MGGPRKKKTKQNSKITNNASQNPVEPKTEALATSNGAHQLALPKSQYHHYIPRFIIRNFALDDHLRHSKERHDIYYYSLADQKLRIADVDTSYGMVDMYADIKNVESLHCVELKLSELERSASKIIRQIIDPLQKEITLTWQELIELRRFLWTMSFRYPGRRLQYTEGRFSESGKEVELEFMKAKDRQTLDDVWLENVQGLLSETLDDLQNNSILDVIGKTTSGDIGKIVHINYKTWALNTFLCIWEAEEPYEFILTDNGFNVWEGNCGRGFPSQAFHHFYPISPRRILVASKVWFKQEGLSLFQAAQLETAKSFFGIDPKDSILAGVKHIPPKVHYHGKLADPFFLSGRKAHR